MTSSTAITPPAATNLTGKIALVTGGSRNIGCETAAELARQGADVVVTYHSSAAAAAEVVDELERSGRRAAAIQVDLTGTGALDRFVDDVRAQLAAWDAEGLDILVNNAGTLRIATFDAVTEDDLDAIFETNYKSLFFLTQRLADVINDGGRIVNLGSGTAEIAFAPLVSYGPVKAALHSLTKYLAAHFGPRGITVNAVAPGGLDDDFNALLFDEIFPPARDYIRSNTAVGRIGMPADIGGVIGFLATDAASFVSGAVLPIDGGYRL
ncbi:MAG: SDR family oxidoreductase [Ilumatobacter sp.]|uniref:SDR family NAD(P)-dependent oxidoreductase n=1 Tax=Ilumatobacter sp. TaxID=1967498 RepID=UPI002612DD53|nr:SDR family oxidoreductase [Ilumatobacter sp.]MDJ0769772.1 SDR family oxidoreductase [Ilumatobacter sp.]